MRQYHEEGAIIKSNQEVSETGGSPKAARSHSRRKFMREAAIGAAAIGAGVALKGGAAAQETSLRSRVKTAR